MTINKSENLKVSEEKNKKSPKNKSNDDKVKKTIVSLCFWSFLKRFLFLQIVLISIIIFFFFIDGMIGMNIFKSIIYIGVTIFALIDVLLVIYSFYIWRNTYFSVREDSAVVYYKQTLFKEKEFFYTLNKNADFKLRQSFFQKVFNCGTIKIIGPTIEEAIYLENIEKPEKVLNMLETISETGLSDTILITQDI